VRCGWPYHGDELLRLVRALFDWRAAGTDAGERREVTLVSGGRRHQLDTILRDAVTGGVIRQL
ncbi:unnamed protein product, partial [Phaeothamnion confervicola]